MALLKIKDIAKMPIGERKEKLLQLKFELVKAGVVANRTNAKTKEIKRAISRLITSSNLQKLEGLRTKSSMFNKSAKEALKKK